MTDPTLLDLARRAVASPHWRWMPGMCDSHGRRIIAIDEISGRAHVASHPGPWALGTKLHEFQHLGDLALPDLTDPATLGCLLALVREAWGQPEIYTRRMYSRNDRWWTAMIGEAAGQRLAIGPTEAAALVAALEAAPERSRDDD